ncbi:glycosyltransferase family 2 protein [Microbulbifer elongatus]|uniref:glycosyltransferase family 2 protein n=1 Tax=Microbulbifer elongatus TaxID=86173 RepID=UPI001E4BE1D5|nr:glycosyltransferase family 2 protein [Microbulbifer elongatus]
MSLALAPTEKVVNREDGFLVIDVSIVIPCLNEVETIGSVVENARSALRLIQKKYELSGEVIVADNGSTDGSVELAQKSGARIEYVAKKGYGAAIRGGIAGSTGRFIIMGDADGAHNFHDAVPMIGKLLSGIELCMGSRFKGHISPGSMPFWNRYVGNPLLTGVLNALFRSGMSDAHCGLRAFTREAFGKLKLSSSGMEFASEMLIKGSLLKMRFAELAVTQHVEGRTREPHLRPIRDGWRHLKYMLSLAPTEVFFLPSLFFFILGVAIYTILISGASDSMQTTLGLSFGDHWVVPASMFLSLSHTLFLTGAASYFYSLASGYREDSRGANLLKYLCRLEFMLIQSIFLLVSALVALVCILHGWSDQDYQNLNAIRELSLVGALSLVAFQHFFCAFLLNLFDN